MSIINHYPTSSQQPLFPSKRTDAQDSIQHHPTALPFPRTHFHKSPPPPPPPNMSGISETAQKGAAFMTKKSFPDGHPLQLQSLFMGPLVRLPGEKPSDREAAKAVLAVSVLSAVELDERQAGLIERKMKKMTGFCNLRMERRVDRSLIAGFVISYGDEECHVIDLSVKGQLAALATKVEFSDR